MSSTAVLTMATAQLPASTTAPRTATMTACCPGCGYGRSSSATESSELLLAQSRIHDLESQVRHLNQKAAAAADRWAAYEAELSKLRAQQTAPRAPSSLAQPQHQLDPASAAPSPTRTSFLQSAPGRISALLYPRKSTPNLRSDTPPLPSSATTNNTTEDLLEALTREKTLRREAEGRLSATSKEVEELSASLFEQANEMVADERRARARLEQRVGELEKRDTDKRRQLERLEVAMQRIEKARSLLDDK
ncbi:GDP/GTP exchange factor sec2p domain-containing protein [Hirsutella rhossiliensis]|uniref:GDP/GTP exchange factor sec2p domain-containing protein n=1 Tax=Hirsutella rhossiliensis TaxID=111463 RepID=A0A9P8N1B9_9HYPO|nr:GDP/GTP exchange factor sec2p domain-containing protein [Hirsutella rhossiliensis]KAH0965080.1 GDP/GTP exchange factor sec2p domain-containing protein [Hirsutella rhossiliensis]